MNTKLLKQLLKTTLRFVCILLISLSTSNFTLGQARLAGTGGTVTEINVSGTYYKVHTYTSTGASTFTPPSGATSVEYLVVAGGGGGGGIGNNSGGAGGGGAGGLLTNVGGTGFSVTVQSYNVNIGTNGSAGTGGNNGGTGGNSVFSTITALGGGGGSSSGVNNNGVTGGSGGGGRMSGTYGTGTTGQGNRGGAGAGGGSGQYGAGGGGGSNAVGANGSGNTGGNGGSGLTNLITGASVTYAAGGKGGNFGTRSAGSNAATNTGNGGGGANGDNNSGSTSGGTGGSGIVIIRYKAPVLAITVQPNTTLCGEQDFSQSPVIQLLDGNGAGVTGIVVTAAIETGSGGSLTNPTATTDINGNATFSGLRLSGTPGNVYTINFTVPGSATKVISNSVTYSTNPLATVDNQSNITCFGAADGTITISASGGVAPYSYSVDNGNNWTSSLTNPFIYGGLTASIPYKIRVKDSNGCTSPIIP